MQWAQALDRGPWLQVYIVPRNWWQTTEGSLSWSWQAGGGSFLLLPRRHVLSSWCLWTFNHNTCENHLEEVQGAATSSLFPPLLSRHVVVCKALVYGVQCSMPVRLGHWQSQTSNVCIGMKRQWSERSAMSSRKTLSPSCLMSYLCSLALKTWPSSWRKEGSAGTDICKAPTVQSSQPETNRLMESVCLGGPRWQGSSWQKDHSYQPSW